MDLETLKQTLDDHGARRVKIGGFDVDGVLRGKYVSRDKLLSAVEKGMGFCDVIFGWDVGDALYEDDDPKAFTGWRTGYPDLEAHVDTDTFRMIPWEPETAAFLLDFDDRVSPRSVLKRVIARAERLGYRAKMAAEFEFFLFLETPSSLREKGYHALEPLTPGMFGYSWLRSSQNADLVHDFLDGLEAFGIPVEGLHTETGPGVYEAALTATDALAAADQAALFKTAVKELASRHGITASFMAKWSTDYPGCSGHIHQSLWDAEGRTPLFADGADPHHMSALMRHYLAGQIQLAPALTALIAPTVNSYKRFVAGTWAPTTVTWGLENRTCTGRVITGPGEKATRVEWRQGGADINPYLAFAATLGAGLHGIEQGLELGAPVSGSAYDAPGAPQIPGTLAAATEALDASAEARDLLGAEFVDHYVRTRRWEVAQHRRAVTDWELARYFELA